MSKVARIRKPRRKNSVKFKDYIGQGMLAIEMFNKRTVGKESHIETFFDENGNKRKKFVPNAIFLESSHTGGVQLNQVTEDGTSFQPLHTFDYPILYRCIVPAIEVLSYYTPPKNNDQV